MMPSENLEKVCNASPGCGDTKHGWGCPLSNPLRDILAYKRKAEEDYRRLTGGS